MIFRHWGKSEGFGLSCLPPDPPWKERVPAGLCWRRPKMSVLSRLYRSPTLVIWHLVVFLVLVLLLCSPSRRVLDRTPSGFGIGLGQTESLHTAAGRSLDAAGTHSEDQMYPPLVYVKTYKTASSTVASLLHNHAVLRNRRSAGFIMRISASADCPLNSVCPCSGVVVL